MVIGQNTSFGIYHNWYFTQIGIYQNWYPCTIIGILIISHIPKLVFYQNWYIPFLVCVYQNWYFAYTNFGIRGVLGVSPNKICSLYTQNAYLAISLTAYISRIWDITP